MCSLFTGTRSWLRGERSWLDPDGMVIVAYLEVIANARTYRVQDILALNFRDLA